MKIDVIILDAVDGLDPTVVYITPVVYVNNKRHLLEFIAINKSKPDYEHIHKFITYVLLDIKERLEAKVL